MFVHRRRACVVVDIYGPLIELLLFRLGGGVVVSAAKSALLSCSLPPSSTLSWLLAAAGENSELIELRVGPGVRHVKLGVVACGGCAPLTTTPPPPLPTVVAPAAVRLSGFVRWTRVNGGGPGPLQELCKSGRQSLLFRLERAPLSAEVAVPEVVAAAAEAAAAWLADHSLPKISSRMSIVCVPFVVATTAAAVATLATVSIADRLINWPTLNDARYKKSCRRHDHRVPTREQQQRPMCLPISFVTNKTTNEPILAAPNKKKKTPSLFFFCLPASAFKSNN